MKISWNWLREYIATEIKVDEAAKILTDIGLEVEAVYPYESVPGGMEGLIVGHVVEVVKHPDADKLKITKVDTGSGTLLNIVCGAPNVAINQKVILAPAGTTVHPVSGEPFTIKKAKIRGVESEGMLCADDEIGLGISHAGLHILPDDAIVGSAVKDLFELYSDTIIEIGLTANHADANSHFGTARELAAALNSRNIEKAELNEMIFNPANDPVTDGANGMDVIVENSIACPRYSGALIKNITIAESPAWLKNKLTAIGMRPISNVVDITNYILHAFGQPLHAFDADKINGNKVVVKMLPAGTTFTTLDEKERKLSSEDLMICDAENGMCIAGVYGGLHSGISSATKNIFIESAYFNPFFIRKSEHRHGLKTEASSRFSKGTDPEMTLPALHKAVELILELCGGEIAGNIIDQYPVQVKPFSVFMRFARLQMMAAIQIPVETIESIINHLKIKIIYKNDDGLQLEVPAYKNDVQREIDIIEEILRVYGYNHIPMPSTVRMPYIVSPKPDVEQIKMNTIDHLSANGFYEIFTNAISKSRYHEKYLSGAVHTQVTLLNSLNAELDSMRQSMLFSGLEIVAFNHNRKQFQLKLFEFGRVYFMHEDQFTEEDKIALFLTGDVSEENWDHTSSPVNFFSIKQEVEKLLARMNVSYEMKSKELPLTDGMEIISNGKSIGYFGQVRKNICDDFDIRQHVFFAELDWKHLASAYAAIHTEFKEIPKFPVVRRDLALILNKEIQYQQVKNIAEGSGGSILRDVILFDVYEGEKLEGKKSYAIGLTFRDDQKTLTDTEVDAVMSKMMNKFEKELNALIRK